MVMDFGFIKDLMMQEIHDPCDHGLILWKHDNDVLRVIDPDQGAPQDLFKWLKLYVMEDVPTAENLARHWYQRLVVAIANWALDRGDLTVDDAPTLRSVTVHETPNSIATYPAPREFPSSGLYIGADGQGFIRGGIANAGGTE